MPETIAAYARDGAVILRRVLDPAEVQRLADGTEHNLAHLSPFAAVASQAATPAVSSTAAGPRYDLKTARRAAPPRWQQGVLPRLPPVF